MPRVSVVIPVYNCETYLEEALQSVFAQTWRDWELIVINDGSTDGTDAVARRHGDRIRYFTQPNLGLAATRGRAVSLATGELVAFLDADDIWLPCKLEAQVQAADEHPHCGIITTDALSFSGDTVAVPSLKTWYRPASGDVLSHLLFGNWIPPSAAMVRRDFFRYVKTFDVPPPGYGEDWLMWMQIAAHAPVCFIDEILVRRRLHAGAMSSQNEDIQFACLMRNFELVRQEVPRLNGSPSLIDRAIYQVSFRRGLRDLRAERLPQAREKLRRAVRHRRSAVRARLALLALACLPWPLLRMAKRWTRRARTLPGAAA